jgi:hypothetical protein
MMALLASPFAVMNGFNSAMVVPSTRNERAEPPRSTRVKGDVTKAAATAHLLGGFWSAFGATKNGFVNLDSLAFATHWGKRAFAHGLADAMRQEPRSFKGHAQSVVKLVRANALFGRAKQVHRLQPKVKRNVGGLENGPHSNGEWLAASIALVKANAGGLSGHLGNSNKAAAMRATRAVRPKSGLDISESGFLVLKVFGNENRVRDSVSAIATKLYHEVGMSSIACCGTKRET